MIIDNYESEHKMSFDGLGFTVHPLADSLPMYGSDLAAELRDSILTRGMHNPIVFNHDGTVLLDGRNRLRAHLELGRSFNDCPSVRVGTGDGNDDLDYVADASLRRDLTVGERLAAAAAYRVIEAELASIRRTANLPGRPKASIDAIGKSAGIAAKRFGVSQPSLERYIATEAVSPELASKVVRGELAVSKAADMAKQLKPQLDRVRDMQPDADVSDLPSFKLQAGTISEAEFDHRTARKLAAIVAENRDFDLSNAARVERHCTRAIHDLRELTAELVDCDGFDSDLAAADRACLAVVAEVQRVRDLIAARVRGEL